MIKSKDVALQQAEQESRYKGVETTLLAELWAENELLHRLVRVGKLLQGIDNAIDNAIIKATSKRWSSQTSDQGMDILLARYEKWTLHYNYLIEQLNQL